MSCTITDVRVSGRTAEIRLSDARVLEYEQCWLRDNCRCPECYNSSTFQRNIHILNLADAKVMKLDFTAAELHITWDDGHESKYTAEFLSSFEYKSWRERNRLRPVLWKGSNVANQLARVKVDDFLNSESGSRAVLQSLLDYGVAIVNEVEPTLEATEAVCRHLGVVQQTIFGGMWKFTSSGDEHADTAYTAQSLPLHTDNTYFTEAAGLQILHCIENSNVTGGETTLVDGFFGATCLREEHPGHFDFLSKFDLEAEYIEPGHHHKYSAPVISVDKKTGDLKQIRFNMNDRSTMAFANAYECHAYYSALKQLGSFYQNPEYRWQFKLLPGTVLIFDNFRVLHGRTEFTGTRVMAGCYISRSDWLDRARSLRLIH